ncbi:MAG: transcriptional repressor LexA [Alphaproteobacteria bacterium]
MLTKQQLNLLSFMKKYKEKEGIPPSYDEMRQGLGIKSKSGIHALISSLEERGFLKRLHHRARAIEIIKIPEILQSGPVFVAREEMTSGAKTSAPTENPGSVRVPFFGKIPTVIPMVHFLQPKEVLRVPQFFINSFAPEKASHYLALEVAGDFLKDSGILDGDVVILEESKDFKENEICLAIIDQNEVYLKKISRHDGKIQLTASNKYMMPLVFEAERVTPKAYVVGLIRKY